jgi:hypothetical protein
MRSNPNPHFRQLWVDAVRDYIVELRWERKRDADPRVTAQLEADINTLFKNRYSKLDAYGWPLCLKHRLPGHEA